MRQHIDRRKDENMNLKDIPTSILVQELSEREGVEKTIADPYQDVRVEVNGPAIVLVIID